jgi:hypothetical protein
MRLTILLASLLSAQVVTAVPAAQAGAEGATGVMSFTQQPQGWEMGKGWLVGPAGARADGDCRATWQGPVLESCWIEVALDLPPTDTLAKGATFSIAVGPAGSNADRIAASGAFAKTQCTFTLAGVGADAKPLSASMARDVRPSVLSEWKEAEKHDGWAGRRVLLGLAIDAGRSRLLVNGCVMAELPAVLPPQRCLSLAAKGVTLRTARISECPPIRYAYLTGAGVAALSGGARTQPATGTPQVEPSAARIDVLGIPMLVERAETGLACLDVGAERWGHVDWSEGKGFLRAPVPARPYWSAHILLHCRREPGKSAAMGFGLRPREMCAGDLRNIYLDARPEYRADEGVTVQPVPALGEGWYLARVPLNPAATQWYTHTPDGNLRPLGSPSAIEAYFCRPWTNAQGLPRPEGKPSSLSVAAVTLEEAGIDLTLTGNGLGNVHCEPEGPRLSATVRNMGDAPVTVQVSTELFPYGTPAARRAEKLELRQPGEAQTIDALARPIRDRGHYRVRVVADVGPARRIDYRTNVAVLAPDTRKKTDSPFGCWSVLWTDNATDAQRNYLKEKAGVAFLMGKHHFDHRMGSAVPDDAAAEAIVKKIPPEVKIAMLGWEHTWTMDQTFAFPRVIAEGTPEMLPKELNDKVDRTAAEWRRVAAAVRRLRPGLKISLGNSAVNFSVPFLERGFKPGVEFDYFGTEEGLFDEAPEQPADAVGNISWWAKAVCEHFGHRNVPLFHSESVYYPIGPAFARMAEATQAANYVRTYLLGSPYRSIFGFSGAMIDSSNSYVYSQWGSSAYCNQAPECSPKLSYVTFATLTQVLDGNKYDGRLDTGTTSVYALRFRRQDNSPLYAIWNLRGCRQLTARFAAGGKPQAVDALNRPVSVSATGSDLPLIAGELPIYVSGVTIESLASGANVPGAPPAGEQLATLDDPEAWTVDFEPDKAFEAPREWRGVPKVRGPFDITAPAGDLPAGAPEGKRLTFSLKPLAGTHGLIPRYIALTAKPGKEIPIPKGTIRLGVWVRGNSTWGQVKLGIRSDDGSKRLLLDDDLAARMTDNFDGWCFLDTGDAGDEALPSGSWKLDRLVVTMPERQVYVDELRKTEKPQLSLWGLHAIRGPLPIVNYLPW